MIIEFRSFRLVWMACLLKMVSANAEDGVRFFTPKPGFTRVADLPDGYQGKIDTLEFAIKDAFDGTPAHSAVEQKLYDLGDKLHIDSKEFTIRRRLFFREGDTVSAELLRENEKNLRSEQFLADAFIEVKRLPDSNLDVRITTYDQWTTVPALAVSRKGGEWIWAFGPAESNLLGTGQQLGYFVGQNLQDKTSSLVFSNTAFTPLKLQLTGFYTWLTDLYSGSNGYSYSFALNRPLLARTDEWSLSLTAWGQAMAEDLYASGNDLDALANEGGLDSSGREQLGQTNLLGQWSHVITHNYYAGITRSFGYFLKSSVTPFYEQESRYQNGDGFSITDTTVWNDLGRPRLDTLDTRHDQLLGLTVNLYQYDYKTVRNYKNLKWSETLETGWRLAASLAQNQTWLGARNTDWLLNYAGTYVNEWANTFYLNSSGSMRYFLSPSGVFDDGAASAQFQVQWKPDFFFATVLSGNYDDLFAATAGQRLYLGGESGLNGFPDYYYGGKARVLFDAEERYFPPFEFGTLVPAFVAFVNAGNTYSAYDEMDLQEMHYDVGIGMNLGYSRSVNKTINHFYFSWPVGERNLGPWSPVKYFSLVASKTL